MKDITTPNQVAACPVCGEKMLPPTKYRPCALCGCTVDDPHGVLSDYNHSVAEHMNFEQMMLVMSDPVQAGDEPSAPASWTREAFMDLAKQRKLARAHARKTGAMLLFDEISCQKCGSGKVVATPSGEGVWRMVCSGCDEPLTHGAIEKAVGEINKLAEKETEYRASLSEAPMVTPERALKDKAVAELRADRKMIEVFPEKQLSSLLENSAIASGDGDEKSRVRQTMKRLMESSGYRPLAMPGPAWRGQIDELQ